MQDKRGHSIGYFSAYYRGLELLLKIYPKIKKEVPDVTLDIAYGWDSWVALEGKNDFYNRMEARFKELKPLGVTVHDRLSHEELAILMKKTKVWAYPTEFPEIFCITAVKANLAGCKPVITDVAALKETGGPSADFITSDTIYSNEYAKEKFTKKLIEALKSEHNTNKQKEWAQQFDWLNVAKSWKEQIDARS